MFYCNKALVLNNYLQACETGKGCVESFPCFYWLVFKLNNKILLFNQGFVAQMAKD
jgi:hypothetical protein